MPRKAVGAPLVSKMEKPLLGEVGPSCSHCSAAGAAGPDSLRRMFSPVLGQGCEPCAGPAGALGLATGALHGSVAVPWGCGASACRIETRGL